MQHTGLTASDATVLWVEVSTLLTLAWLLGKAARRIGQPPIVGSLVAGLVAGPSVFGEIWPAGFHWFRPATALSAGLLAAVANFSLLILLIALGAEVDLGVIKRLGRPAAAVIPSSIVFPLAAGGAIAWLLPATFLGASHHRSAFVLLLAGAMAVSSLPVIARIVTEMGVSRRNVGQMSIATATVNDGVGFVLLAIAVALIDPAGMQKLIVAAVGLVALVVLVGTVGQRALDAQLRNSRRGGPDLAAGVGASVVFVLIMAAVAQALGVDAALGAFLAGVVVGRSRYVAPRVLDTIRVASDAVFAPLYFATAGVSVNVALLGRGNVAVWFFVVLVVAVLSKFVSAYAGGRIAGAPARESAALGISLNGRGALQVILASAGLTAGIISATAFAAIILLSIISSVLVPPALRAVLRNWRGTEEEQERLAREEELRSNVVVRGQRLLLPSRGSSNSIAAARVLDLAWPPESEVTLLQVGGNDADPRGLDAVRQMLASREVEEDSADGDIVSAILGEADLGYGVIAVGAADAPTTDSSLPVFIEGLLNESPIPVLLVRRGAAEQTHGGIPLIRPRQILVPLTGSAASRAGEEIAHCISGTTGADVTFLHVVTREEDASTESRPAAAPPSARAVLTQAQQAAAEKDIDVDVVVRHATSSAKQIQREAERIDADIVVMGTTVRRVDGRPFLGHTVEHILQRLCDPTVVVVALPDAQQMTAGEHIDRRAG